MQHQKSDNKKKQETKEKQYQTVGQRMDPKGGPLRQRVSIEKMRMREKFLCVATFPASAAGEAHGDIHRHLIRLGAVVVRGGCAAVIGHGRLARLLAICASPGGQDWRSCLAAVRRLIPVSPENSPCRR